MTDRRDAVIDKTLRNIREQFRCVIRCWSANEPVLMYREIESIEKSLKCFKAFIKKGVEWPK